MGRSRPSSRCPSLRRATWHRKTWISSRPPLPHWSQGKYIEAPGYQGRFQQAQTSFQSAKTTHDYFLVDGFAQDQVAALAAYSLPTDHLQQLNTMVTAEQKLLAPDHRFAADQRRSSAPTAWAPARQNTGPFTMDLIALSAGQARLDARGIAVAQPGSDSLPRGEFVQRLCALNQLLDGQIAQVQATNATLVPSVAASYLAGSRRTFRRCRTTRPTSSHQELLRQIQALQSHRLESLEHLRLERNAP